MANKNVIDQKLAGRPILCNIIARVSVEENKIEKKIADKLKCRAKCGNGSMDFLKKKKTPMTNAERIKMDHMTG